MKRLYLLAVVAALASPAGPARADLQRPSQPPGPAAPRPVPIETIDRYVAAQEALAADDLPAARAALERLAAVAGGELATLSTDAARSPDVAAMRLAFKPLSERLAATPLPPGFVVAYCPMYEGGSNWVQRGGEVANPYYGAAMLRCGTIDASPGSHMDHSPRYGGIFFMAPDAWHHLEGTYPETGLFRLRIYDNFTELIDPRNVKGRAVIREVYDRQRREYRELMAYPLLPSPDGLYLEARVGTLELPAEITAKVRFTPESGEERFDFIFAGVSTEPAQPTPTTAAIDPTTPIQLFDRAEDPIPDLPDDIALEIGIRDMRVAQLIRRGAFTEIFIPALEAKELALALEPHLTALESGARREATLAIRRIVRSAWLLDTYGDIGNGEKVGAAYTEFGAGVRALKQVYGVP